jgi:hypothetical protein
MMGRLESTTTRLGRIATWRCSFWDAPNVTLLDTWLVERVQLLTDLSSFGFPHAATQSPTGDRLDMVFRAYRC